jgi:ABC-type cobalamin/Fe3+-siderophores transport system ATPase subunit
VCLAASNGSVCRTLGTELPRPPQPPLVLVRSWSIGLLPSDSGSTWAERLPGCATPPGSSKPLHQAVSVTSLLELDRVGTVEAGSRVALADVSLAMDAGEMVVVWGERRSGRSKLLRIAAGIETPDRGVVRFGGRVMPKRSDGILGQEVGYCRRELLPHSGANVLEQLIAGQLARRVRRPAAEAGAWRALERVDGEECGRMAIGELKGHETVLVALARALTSQPRLIVIDEPTLGLEVVHRDRILQLLRSLADESIAVLASANDGTGLLGADRVLSLDNGRLRGETMPVLAPVAHLEDRRRAHG